MNKPHLEQSQKLRAELHQALEHLVRDSVKDYTGHRAPDHEVYATRARSLARTRLEEAIGWMDAEIRVLKKPE